VLPDDAAGIGEEHADLDRVHRGGQRDGNFGGCHEQETRRIVRHILAFGLAAAFAMPGCARSSRESPQNASVAGAPTVSASTTSSAPAGTAAPLNDTEIESLRQAAQKILGSANESDLDVERKALELGADVNRQFAFVRDSIRFQIYRGVLRGARGTLTGRAGNSWDKAILLAALLRHHGRDVRFARGRLPNDRASALVATMLSEAGWPFAVPAPELPPALVARGRSEIAAIETRWRNARSDLMDALTRDGMTLGRSAPIAEAALADEAADHAWIEYRDGDRWVPLDPTAGKQAGEAVAAAIETYAQVPESLHHRVTFRVKVEQRRGQNLEARDAFVWRSTAAALHGANLLFGHHFDQTPLGQWRATPALIVDGQAYAALSLTAAGLEETNISDALVGEASRQMRGVGQISELFGAPAPAPSQTGPAVIDFTAEWLDVEFTGPDSRAETVRREIVDRIGPVARGQGAAATAPLSPMGLAAGIPISLAGIYAPALTAGPLDSRLFHDRLATALAVRDDVPALQGVKERDAAKLSAADRARVDRVVTALPQALNATAQLIHALSQTLARRLVARDTAIEFYEATPRLVFVSLEPSGALTVDLRRNAVRVVGRSVPGQDLVRANIARGVLDGVIEDAIVAHQVASVRALSTVSALESARALKIPVTASKQTDAARGNASEPARARIQQMDGAPVIVAPTRLIQIGSSPRMAWWSVDVATGDTLGVLDSGLHGAQAIPERAAISHAEARAIGQAVAGPSKYVVTPPVDALAATMPNGFAGLGAMTLSAAEYDQLLFAISWGLA
jgi:hypothetical protein